MTARSNQYVYISGPLQAADDLTAARRLYNLIADVCREAGWEVYLPHQHTDPIDQAHATPASVFERDYEKVRQASLVIAHVGLPSSGVGAELGIALEHKIPVITLQRASERPSRFIQGMMESTGLPVIVFDNDIDCRTQLRTALDRIPHSRRRRGQQRHPGRFAAV
jgi:nucleoside 2-deoxyribosyltransferase